jgi:hypothetical protein
VIIGLGLGATIVEFSLVKIVLKSKVSAFTANKLTKLIISSALVT